MKRIHQIAKEQGLTALELLVQLRDAGFEVTAAAQEVDEQEVISRLGLNGGAVVEQPFKPKAKAAPKAEPEPEPEAVATLVEDPPPPVEEAPAPKRKRKAAGPKILEELEEPAADVEPEPEPAPEPVAVEEPEPEVAEEPEAEPEAEAPAADAVAEEPVAEEPEAAEEPKDDEPLAVDPEGKAPAPGTGPKILAVPEPPKRPKRDETQPGGRTGGDAGTGRRRVVIDSQAARRGPGGPGGPGGPQSQPPRRQRRGRRRRGTYNDTVQELDVTAQTSIDLIKVNSGSSVKDVAEYLGVPVPEVIKKLMTLGEMATLTQTLSDDAIQVIADEFDREIEIVHVGDEAEDAIEYDDAEADMVVRPPVVTIMGHVDHGKTSLLDAIRETEVVAGEAGGITQHIGAYQAHHNDHAITFLDTPGHEAFTAMRARGARVTDIAIIVVAADDGVKPQTQEAIDHALAAEVPILVAVNKVDKEGADPQRVRTEMTQLGLQPAEWGGEIEFVDVSAKAKTGLEDLLDTILVVAELEDLKANPSADASGVVIESKLDPGRGPVVTVLIQRGTMSVGDALVAGPEWGKVRAMHDYKGTKMKTAIPGDPVEILGFDGVPSAGETVRVVDNDRDARRQATERGQRLKTEALARRSGRKVSLDDVFKRALASEYKELPLLIKADVAGSLEAIEDEIAKLPQGEVQVNIIHAGVGGITESDAMLAAASEAVILAFNVRPVGDARIVADREGVEIRHYSVIYKALDELRDVMEGMLDPEEVEDTVGEVEVRQLFRASKIGTIAGCYVTEGKVTRGAKVRIIRDGTVVHETTIAGLRRFNDDVREVAAGFECGITLTNYQDLREGDTFEVFETRHVVRELQG